MLQDCHFAILSAPSTSSRSSVQPTPPSRLVIGSSAMHTLFCLVDGEAFSKGFSVKVYAAATVDDLKDVIKADKASDLLTTLPMSSPSEKRPSPLQFTSMKPSPSARWTSKKFTVSLIQQTTCTCCCCTSSKQGVPVMVQRPPQESDKAERIYMQDLNQPDRKASKMATRSRTRRTLRDSMLGRLVCKALEPSLNEDGSIQDLSGLAVF